MKRSLAILFAILSLSIFLNIEGDRDLTYNNCEAHQSSAEYGVQSFSQGDTAVDLNGRRGSSSTLSISKLLTKTLASRRDISSVLSGVKIAIANIYSEHSYSYSCDFPFEHQPQRELFFILRNIRI